MEFKYFLGPIEEMCGRAPEDSHCSLCESEGPGFWLDQAICKELSAEAKEEAIGCLSCIRKGRFEFWHDTEIGLLDSDGLRQMYNHNKPPPESFPPAALLELRRTPRYPTQGRRILSGLLA